VETIVTTSSYIREIVVSRQTYIKILRDELVRSHQFNNLKVGEEFRVVEKGTGFYVRRCLHAFVGDYVYWR
jgi:hypothetical protein